MYTCCPICKTNFKVTEAQLQVAQGKVRCGSCKNVFNARQHIHYKTIKKTTPQTGSLPTKPIHSPATPPEQTKTFSATKVSEPVVKENKKATAKPDEDKSPLSDIDAIFNALDSQLTSGTYQDIAGPVEKDIREADFDDDFESEINDDEPDLDLYASSNLTKPTNTSRTAVPQPDNNEVISNKIKTEEPADEILIESENINTATTESEAETDNKEIQQHAFEFKIPNEETSLKNNDDVKTASEKNNKKPANKGKNAALHEAIDNIIKVENNIPTPFDEHEDHKDDHFVIEMHSEPDVELVDENDIDKLFASTDSLKISDLKFNKVRNNESTDDIEKPSDGPDSLFNDDVKTNDAEEKIESIHNDSDADSFNQQVEEQLNPQSFSSDSIQLEKHDEHDVYDEDNFAEDFDANEFENKDNVDDVEAEEEIVLSSADEHVDIPHRLRDAVASLNQQTMSLKSKIIYIASSVLLIVLLFFQLVLFKSTTLANSFPVLQPFLLSMCDSLPCRYTGNHNSKRIKIISRDVRLHPKIKGALLISATIVNQADYPQPYPTIQLKFTDLTGATVAQRYFQPNEYLGLLNKPFALMPAKQPVQLNIEILDPGSDAINFQFFFL